MSLGGPPPRHLILAKWSKYTTHKGSTDLPISLFLHSTPSVKFTPPSPQLFHEEDATEIYQSSNYSFNIYLQWCVMLFNFSVSWYSEIRFGMIYLETWGSTQPFVAFLTLVVCSCYLAFLVEHTQHQILLHYLSQCLLCLELSLLIWLMGGACLPCLAVWGQDTLPGSCDRSLTNVSLYCQCDNFEP